MHEWIYNIPKLQTAKRMERKIVIASDHGGYELKEYLKEVFADYNFEDYGTFEGKAVDYPDIAFKACEDIISGKFDQGILICGTGIGISIAANKVKGIRAAHCTDCFSAEKTREHNDANVIVLGGRITGPELAAKILETYLTTDFSGDKRHVDRIAKVTKYEEEHCK